MIRKNQRGVSPVIGSMLLLMTLVLFLSWYQIAQVPIINQDVEFDSNNDAINSMLKLKSSQLNVLVQNKTIDSTTLNNVVEYPLQPIRPRDSAGTIRFDKVEDPYAFSNLDDPALINGLPNETRTVEYNTRYLELTNRNYTLRNGLLIDDKDSGIQILDDDQIRIRQNRIYLYQMRSEINSVTVKYPEITIERVNKKSTTITPSDLNDDTKPLEFKFKSDLNKTVWQNTLDPQESQYIEKVSKSGDYITVELNENRRYTVIQGKGEVGV
jgi:hypothetical protein